MDKVLEVTESFASVYLNDVVVFSNSWEEHLSHLQTVLHEIKEIYKCYLAKQDTQYLGFVLGKGVIRPQVGKVVKSSMGLVGWYSHFIHTRVQGPTTMLD